MRKLGYTLLIIGFLAVLHLASSRISHALWVAREQREALPQQDAFTKKEVEDAISKATLASRQSGVAAILPGLLMVCGAILLDRAKTHGKTDDKIA